MSLSFKADCDAKASCAFTDDRIQKLLWLEILFTLLLTSIGTLIVVLHSSEEPHFDKTSEIWSHVLAPGRSFAVLDEIRRFTNDFDYRIPFLLRSRRNGCVLHQRRCDPKAQELEFLGIIDD